MLRIIWVIIVLLAMLAPAYGQYLGRMLADDVFPMQGGSLVWLAEGPVTGGDMADLAIADLNGDGQEDLLVGSGYGDLLYYRRLAGDIFAAPQPLIADSTDSASWPPKPRQVSPAIVDWNDDGQLDLLLGWEGQLLWYQLRGVALRGGQAMRLADGTKITEAIRQVALEVGHLAPAVGDVDGDGDHDLLLGGDDGSVWWLERTTDNGKHEWQAPRRLRAGGSPVEVGSRARPCVLDWGGDGHKDVLIGQGQGELWLLPGVADGLEAAERISVRG
ncbi:MAG: VCBS repeat-containing protein, partial [Armatimonadetes bacterium]|nr:VCBS repeat-containing protein [Armatimonadota bacterium]